MCEIKNRRSVLVTGATNGTGYAIAERFACEGYDVFIGSRDIERSSEAAKTISPSFNFFVFKQQSHKNANKS